MYWQNASTKKETLSVPGIPGNKDYHWDMCWSELNADINSAEVGQEISTEQAWYLRENYLRMKRGD